MSIDRRRLFALGGLGAVGAGTGALGPELNLHGGITVTLYQDLDGWKVAVPDFDYAGGRWRAGSILPMKGMPITEFLAELEKLPEQSA
jgi:hypothetical protein